jgi:hypothetical protein
MNKLAITIAALSLSAGAAFAENPNIGNSNVIQSGPQAGQSTLDQGTTASVGEYRQSGGAQGVVNYIDPTANRSGDGAPRN